MDVDEEIKKLEIEIKEIQNRKSELEKQLKLIIKRIQNNTDFKVQSVSDTHIPIKKNIICVYKRQNGGTAKQIMETFNTSGLDTSVLELRDNDTKVVLYTMLKEDNPKENLTENKKHYNLSNGVSSSVYKITELATNTKYILKITTGDNNELIKKYELDKMIFPDIKKHLIDIKYYGEIKVPMHNMHLVTYNYMIVPVYSIFDETFISTPSINKYIFLRKLATLINILQHTTPAYSMNDLKPDNIGYDQKTKEIILIDYEQNTLHIAKSPPSFGFSYRSPPKIREKNEHICYYPFAMVLITFFFSDADENIFNIISKCIRCSFGDGGDNCEQKQIDEVIGIIRTDYEDVYSILQKCIDNNRATEIKYFSEIVEIIDSIIQKIDTPSVLVGGYNSYKINKTSYMGILNM
jgi:hypothetical protein